MLSMRLFLFGWSLFEGLQRSIFVPIVTDWSLGFLEINLFKVLE